MSLRPGITVDVLNGRGHGCLPGLMGFRVMALEQGLLVAELDIRPDLLAPNGFLHAATIVALADTACGYGCLAHLPQGAANFTTVELKSNFFATAREGTVAAVARPVHLGNSTQVWDAEVTRKADGRQMALFRCTQLILWPKAWLADERCRRIPLIGLIPKRSEEPASGSWLNSFGSRCLAELVPSASEGLETRLA